jgi:Ca2+-binding EF-hand superfamily protein
MTDLIRSVGELIAMSDVNGCLRRVTTGQNGKMDAADFAGFWLRYQRIGTRFV